MKTSQTSRFLGALGALLLALLLLGACSASAGTPTEPAAPAVDPTATGDSPIAADERATGVPDDNGGNETGNDNSGNDTGNDNGGNGESASAVAAGGGASVTSTTGVSTPDVGGLSFAEVVAEFGPLEQTWAGPLSTDYVCAAIPQDHVFAVLTGREPGAQFEMLYDRVCELELDRGSIRVSAFDSSSANSVDGIVRYMSGEMKPAPVHELPGRVIFHSGPQVQEIVVADGIQVFHVTGPGTDVMADAQIVAFTEVVVSRFSTTTRVDADSQPLTVDELALVTNFLDDYAAAISSITATEGGAETLMPFAEESFAGSRADFQVDWPKNYEFTVLRSARYQETSRGDVIELHLCEFGQAVPGDDAGFDAWTDPIMVIDVNTADFRIVASDSTMMSSEPFCTEPAYLAEYDAEQAAERDAIIAQAQPQSAPDGIAEVAPATADEPKIDNEASTETVGGLDRATFDAMSDDEFRAMMGQGATGPIDEENVECYLDTVLSELDRDGLWMLWRVENDGVPHTDEVREVVVEANINCGVITDIVVYLAIFNEAELAAEDSECLSGVLTTEDYARTFLDTILDNPDVMEDMTADDINGFLLELADC